MRGTNDTRPRDARIGSKNGRSKNTGDWILDNTEDAADHTTQQN